MAQSNELTKYWICDICGRVIYDTVKYPNNTLIDGYYAKIPLSSWTYIEYDHNHGNGRIICDKHKITIDGKTLDKLPSMIPDMKNATLKSEYICY
jgi:hypothetical protein